LKNHRALGLRPPNPRISPSPWRILGYAPGQ